MSQRCCSCPAIALTLLMVGQAAGQESRPKPTTEPARLGMTPAIACESITAYEQYVPLAEPAVTRDDKLLVYYQPTNYAIIKVGSKYQAHFTQDVRIRRRGQKPVIWAKEKLFDYTQESAYPPYQVCLTNKISMKLLTPGDYDLDIILHDQNAKGATAEQTFRFRVKASPPPAKDDAKDKPDDSEEPPRSP
jgi:hypothetical protein